ncbi:MAG TPA: glutathione peroxidase [Flavilitoribacter sp.]|nr:glutathione peroxidase [Flavilitoribacter sp.]HMQ86695.1 glutathione peroxidase [Flavilitoribacter sp.]
MSVIHQFSVEGIDGGTINFADFKGKKIMVVNVASECGFTPQYQQLQELYETFGDRLAIVGFPSNDFGGQEPGTHAEIKAFCTRHYGVSFPLTVKIHIKAPDTHPVYAWLTAKKANGVMDCEVQWNFWKFLLDENGRLVNCLPSNTSPFDESVLNWISSGE